MLTTDVLPTMDRRALLRSAILLVGGSLAGLPGEALAQAAKAGFFTAPELATVAEAAEIIIPRTDTPGAKDAGVPASLDLLMSNWASKQRQGEFRALLGQLNQAGVAAGGASFARLAPAKRFEVMKAFDAEKLKAWDQPYVKFKELVMTLYYLSEVGATKELRYELIPGKWEPWTEMGTDARAWAV